MKVVYLRQKLRIIFIFQGIEKILNGFTLESLGEELVKNTLLFVRFILSISK